MLSSGVLRQRPAASDALLRTNHLARQEARVVDGRAIEATDTEARPSRLEQRAEKADDFIRKTEAAKAADGGIGQHRC